MTMKITFCFIVILLRGGFFAITLPSITSTESNAAEKFSKFGIIRANIAQYASGNRWLVCYEPKHGIENGELVNSEVVGFDAEGNIFRIQGDVRLGAKNLLSLESYDNPSVAFSTKEGYLYIWNSVNGDKPFEYFMKLKEYKKLIEKFELYPLLGLSKDAPVKFELLKESPDFYNQALALPRPESVFHLQNPKAKKLRVGIFLNGKPNNSRCLVKSVLDNSAASAAGIEANDTIVSIAINGEIVEMEKCFPIPDDKSIRVLSFKVVRRSADNGLLYLNINGFLQSPLESFLVK